MHANDHFLPSRRESDTGEAPGAEPFSVRGMLVSSLLLFLALPLAADVPEAPGADPSPPVPQRQPLNPDDPLAVPRDGEKALGPATVIQGDQLEMIADEHTAHFVFTDNIRVTGNNITMTCDRLEVISSRDDGDESSDERLAGMGRIRLIVASGRVHVFQEGREALAGRAEVLPDEGRVILTESPVIRDSQGEVSGERIILYQGLERAVVESSAERPARVTLPTLPDLGFRDRDGREETEESPE